MMSEACNCCGHVREDGEVSEAATQADLPVWGGDPRHVERGEFVQVVQALNNRLLALEERPD